MAAAISVDCLFPLEAVSNYGSNLALRQSVCINKLTEKQRRKLSIKAEGMIAFQKIESRHLSICTAVELRLWGEVWVGSEL